MSLNDRLSSKVSSDMTTEAGTKHVFATCLPRVFKLFATCTCVRHVFYTYLSRVHAFATCLSCVCTCARVCHCFPCVCHAHTCLPHVATCLPRACRVYTCLQPVSNVFATCKRVCRVFATFFHSGPRHVITACLQCVYHVFPLLAHAACSPPVCNVFAMCLTRVSTCARRMSCIVLAPIATAHISRISGLARVSWVWLFFPYRSSAAPP